MAAPALLGPEALLPLDRPFVRNEALSAGVTPARLARYLRDGLLVSPLRGVLHVAQLPDSLDLRISCARLVVPADAVITDRTAAWLHMAPMVLAPGDHLRVPDIDVFRSPGNRVRRAAVRSGERMLLPTEIVDLDGLRVTSKLRTICDLGMQLPRRPAFAAMCMMMKVADFTLADISRLADTRFKGYRWVNQLRSLTPHLEPRLDSPGECWLVLCWLDELTLPDYEPQFEVAGPGGSYFLDLAVPELRYAAEYDGVEWHGPDQSAHDLARRTCLREERDWVIDVFEAADVTGPAPRAGDRLRAGLARARRRLGGTASAGRDTSAGSAPYGVTQVPGQRSTA